MQGQNIIDNIHKHLEYYELFSDKYVTYLRGHRTVESSNEEASHRLVRSSLCDKTAAFVNQLQSALPKMESSKAPSLVPSVTSGKSGSNQLIAVWMQHSANVDKAKARLKYAAEEAELIKQEAALKASRKLLTVKRELEEAESGLSAICKVLDFSQSTTKSEESDHGSYKPLCHPSFMCFVKWMITEMIVPPPDVPPEVNVHEHVNDKPLPQKPTHTCTKPSLCATENKTDETNPNVVLSTPKQNLTEAADLAN